MRLTFPLADKLGRMPKTVIHKHRVLDWLIKEGHLISKEVLEFRKPTHGTCCTCQKCGWANDGICACENNRVLNEIEEMTTKIR